MCLNTCNKYMKDYDENKESSFLECLDASIYMAAQCQNHYLLIASIGFKICLK